VHTEQINISYQTGNSFGSFWSNLANRLKPITLDISLNDWIELIGNSLYNRANQTKQCVDIEKYYPLTKIRECVYNKDLLVNARLLPNESDFIIELKDYGVYNDFRKHRYFIAHEIAHTFFYDTKRNRVTDLRLYPAGSKEIEFICNRIARSILLPNIVLQNKMHKIPNPKDESFTLEEVIKLCNAFRVDYNVLLSRIIFDTGVWNCLFLRFRKYEGQENPWKLKEKFLPAYYWQNKKAYIPQEDLNKPKDNPNRYPSAKGLLGKELSYIFSEYSNEEDENEKEKKKRGYKKFKSREINESPLKSFIEFYFTENENVLVHFSIAKDKYTKADYINICIPLKTPQEMK
jgi:hypothetical protein